MSKDKPTWWPKNPYPEDIFVMKRERYAEIVPDPDLRTGLSGMLGREFWEIASNTIWELLQFYLEEHEPYKDMIMDIGAAMGNQANGSGISDANLLKQIYKTLEEKP